MVEITVTADRLLLEVKGSHKFWAFKSSIDVPLEHVKEVHADPEPAMGWFQGLKLIGTDIPNLFRAGTFLQEGDKVFWDVQNPANTIVIELHDENCEKLIVEVEDPYMAVARIRQALANCRKTL